MAGLHRKRKPRPTTTPAYMAMLARMLRAGTPRLAQDPAGGLPGARDLEAAVTDMVNAGIFLANRDGGQSYNQLADIMGVSKAAVIKRAKLGEAVVRVQEQAKATHGPDLPIAVTNGDPPGAGPAGPPELVEGPPAIESPPEPAK